LQVQRCSIRPSGFQIPRTHVAPQSHFTGPGGEGASRIIDADADATAADAFGASRSIACGSLDSQIRIEMNHRQSIYQPFP
jgi:hypothetical protein